MINLVRIAQQYEWFDYSHIHQETDPEYTISDPKPLLDRCIYIMSRKDYMRHRKDYSCRRKDAMPYSPFGIFEVKTFSPDRYCNQDDQGE